MAKKASNKPKLYDVSFTLRTQVEAENEADAKERAIIVIGNRFYTKSGILQSMTADWEIKEANKE